MILHWHFLRCTVHKWGCVEASIHLLPFSKPSQTHVTYRHACSWSCATAAASRLCGSRSGQGIRHSQLLFRARLRCLRQQNAVGRFLLPLVHSAANIAYFSPLFFLSRITWLPYRMLRHVSVAAPRCQPEPPSHACAIAAYAADVFRYVYLTYTGGALGLLQSCVIGWYGFCRTLAVPQVPACTTCTRDCITVAS